jgi:hypothetical protein
MSETDTRTNVARHHRTPTPNNPPPPHILLDGEISIEQADPMRLWIGVPVALDPTGRRLLYDASAIVAGGVSVTVGDQPPSNPKSRDLWFCSADTQLYIYYDDGNGPPQWVIANNQSLGGGSSGGEGGIPEAPTDGRAYGRQSLGWTQVIAATGDVVDGGNF